MNYKINPLTMKQIESILPEKRCQIQICTYIRETYYSYDWMWGIIHYIAFKNFEFMRSNSCFQNMIRVLQFPHISFPGSFFCVMIYTTWTWISSIQPLAYWETNRYQSKWLQLRQPDHRLSSKPLACLSYILYFSLRGVFMQKLKTFIDLS